MNTNGMNSPEDMEVNPALNHEELLSEGSEIIEEESPSSNTDILNEVGEDWKGKFNELNDRYLRLYSEFDNFRKRSARERIELNKTASSDIVSVLLPVLDDFDRAAKAVETAAEISVVKEGMQLIHHKLKNLLMSKGLEEMNAKGELFDAELHEAITSIETGDETLKGKVVDEVEKGYSLNGKVIRFAKVVVGS
jgi:molecular chaperone GrpE